MKTSSIFIFLNIVSVPFGANNPLVERMNIQGCGCKNTLHFELYAFYSE